MISIKFLNNVGRINMKLLQDILSTPENINFTYHIITFILSYCCEYSETSEDIKDLLHEVKSTFLKQILNNLQEKK
jgi:hypothetical protein